jgi:hypothetical protein
LLSSDADHNSSGTHEEKGSIRDEGKSGDAIPGGGVFDIQTFSLEAMKALPIELISALAKASRFYLPHNPKEKTLAHEELAERFRRLMELNGKSHVAKSTYIKVLRNPLNHYV